MPRETQRSIRERAFEVERRMDEHYPSVDCFLSFWDDPFKLTVAVMMSAQTTDENVNSVTPRLWDAYPTIESLASASQSDVEELIRPVGFFRMKAKNAIGIAQSVLAEFGGEVPRDMDQLQTLPGVGRKTANIVLNQGFGIVEGIAVDTHVDRVAHRLKLVPKTHSATQTEMDLLKLYPREFWGRINHQWILFGRQICNARSPKCAECFLADICPSFGKV